MVCTIVYLHTCVRPDCIVNHRCGPCHMIAPTFESFASQYKNVNFLKCDVDAAKDVASTYSVSAMFVHLCLSHVSAYHILYRPTFIFLKGSTKVDLVRGANKAYVFFVLQSQ